MVLSCFGKLCATEASKQPKKRYNDYVPAVFPNEAPDWRSLISAGTARNISTVQDYVGENIQRAPKVSRRLWRRIVADHSNDAALGQVKVGVHCYIGLLSSMSEGDTSLLAEEIIRKADSVVPLLMSSKGDSAEDNARRILGLELLVHFIRAQSSSDVSSLLAERVQESCLLLKQGGCAERDSAALRVLREHINYTRRLTIPCEHLATIQTAAQDWLLQDSKEAGVPALDPGFVQSQQVGDLYTTTQTSKVAQAVLQELALLCQDATVGTKVVANGLRSITSHHAWDGGSRQQVTLQELRAGQQASGAQLLLLSGLLDELGSSSLQEVATPAVLQAVSQEASSLPRSLAPSALAKVLTATAPLLPLEDVEDSKVSPESSMVGECVKGLVRDCQEPELLLESIATTLGSADYQNPQSAIRKVKAANIAIRGLPTGVQAPSVLYTEMCRLATMPAQAPGEPPLTLQACASRAATDALQLHSGVLKSAAVQALLQNVDHQLAPTVRHTPQQLAAAADLHNAVAARAPVEAVIDSVNATVPRMGGAAAAPRSAAEAVDVMCANQHCLNFAFQHLQPPQVAPMFLSSGSCKSMQPDPQTGKLVVTGVKQDEAASAAALQVIHQTGQAQKFCASVEQVLASHPPPASTGSAKASLGAAWAPDAAALAATAAKEDGDGYVLHSADPLMDSTIESQTHKGSLLAAEGRKRTRDHEECAAALKPWEHVQEYSEMRAGGAGGMLWGVDAQHRGADQHSSTPCAATPAVTTPAGTTPGGTTDDMDAYFMMPPSPGEAPVSFSPAAGLQDPSHSTNATGQVGVNGQAFPNAAAPNAAIASVPTSATAGTHPVPAGLPQLTKAALQPVPNAEPVHTSQIAAGGVPAPPVGSLQAAVPALGAAPNQAAPIRPPATAEGKVGAPEVSGSGSSDPTTSLQGMLAPPPFNALPAQRETTGPEDVTSGSEDSCAAAAVSATQLASRRVFKPEPASSPVADAATDIATSAHPHAGGPSQVSNMSIDTGVPGMGAYDANDESLSLPLGPPRTNNKPLHVLPPTSPARPPAGPSGTVDNLRDSSAWSPLPNISVRSLHALPGGPDSHRGITPTSSIGDVSTWSRYGTGRSLHAVPKQQSVDRSQTELLTPDTGGAAAPGSPSGMSVGSCASSRRKGRPSLHVMQGSTRLALPGPSDAATAPV